MQNMSKMNYGKSNYSPKARANMKREAEKQEIKSKKSCHYSSISELMKDK